MKLKKKVEALLFSSGRKMTLEELSRLCRSDYELLHEALNELQQDYEEKHSSLMVVQEGNAWKISVREEHLPLIQKIVTKTELSKALMETLAVIAFKYPIKQSELIKIRSNKGYDHIRELEEAGYITRQRFGRTKLIKLTQKFYDYFSLSEDKLQEQFKDFKQLADTIDKKEEDIKQIKAEQQEMAEQARKEKEQREKEGGIIVEELEEGELEVYNQEQKEDIKEEDKKDLELEPDKLGKLEIIDEPEELDVPKRNNNEEDKHKVDNPKKVEEEKEVNDNPDDKEDPENNENQEDNSNDLVDKEEGKFEDNIEQLKDSKKQIIDKAKEEIRNEDEDFDTQSNNPKSEELVNNFLDEKNTPKIVEGKEDKEVDKMFNPQETQESKDSKIDEEKLDRNNSSEEKEEENQKEKKNENINS